MRPVLIGDADDARGLSLAGVDAYVCTTREQVEKCVAQTLQSGRDTLILFSASAARLIAERIAAWRRDGSGPPFVVLPR